MKTIDLRVPEALHEKLRELARRDGISVAQLLLLTAAQRVYDARETS